MTNEQIINSISKDAVIPNGVNESLSFSDVVKDSHHHIYNDLGKDEVSVSDIMNDIVNNYDGYSDAEGTSPEESARFYNSIIRELEKLGLQYIDLEEDNMNEDVNKSRNEMMDIIDFAYGRDWISDEVLMANGASEGDDGEEGYFTGMTDSQIRDLYKVAVKSIKNEAESNPVTWKSWGGLNRLNELGFDWNIDGTKLIQE
jgi:hypothetical protein